MVGPDWMEDMKMIMSGGGTIPYNSSILGFVDTSQITTRTLTITS